MSAPLNLEGSIDIAAPPARVFALWADPAGWPVWDPDLVEAELVGPFAVGSRGAVRPVKGPRTRIVLREVTPARSFAAVSDLPLCRMVFEHTIHTAAVGCRVTHAVRFEGPLAMLYRRLIGPSIERGLPGTMMGLKRAAERSN